MCEMMFRHLTHTQALLVLKSTAVIAVAPPTCPLATLRTPSTSKPSSSGHMTLWYYIKGPGTGGRSLSTAPRLTSSISRACVTRRTTTANASKILAWKWGYAGLPAGQSTSLSPVLQEASTLSAQDHDQARPSSIAVTSSESRSTVVAPARSLSKKVASFSARLRFRDKSKVLPLEWRRLRQCPPRANRQLFIATPPSTTSLATEPGPDFVEPRNAMPFANTGKRCRSMAATSRTVPSITSAARPATSATVVSTSPKYPRGVSSPNTIASTDPRGASVTAACNARLSPGAQNAVKAAGKSSPWPHRTDPGAEGYRSGFSERCSPQGNELLR